MNIKELRDALNSMIVRYGDDREVVFIDDTYTEHHIKNVYLYAGKILLGKSEKITSLDPEY